MGFVMLRSHDLRNATSHHEAEVDDCRLLPKQDGGK